MVTFKQESIKRGNLVDVILTEKDKQIALGIIHALREANMMGDAIQTVARRFSLQFNAVADWYYTKYYES